MKHAQTLAHKFLIMLVLAGATLGLHAQDSDTPPLPQVFHRDSKSYAYAWDGSAWQVIPRNEARVLYAKKESGKQHIGTLVIDGCYKVPAVSGQNVTLLYRAIKNFKTYKGMPEEETGFEVTRLDCKPGYKKDAIIRTAQLQRLGEAAATFGDKREPMTVIKYERYDGVFWVIKLDTVLTPGRYALYLPDRAFEFEIAGETKP